jgi:hypothetical protein
MAASFRGATEEVLEVRKWILIMAEAFLRFLEGRKGCSAQKSN